jgi:nucleotide-binding universal stress UspA family protein
MSITKIAVGVDFSVESRCAVDHALLLGRQEGARLVLVHVANIPLPQSVSPDDPYAALYRERLADARRALNELRERLSGQGVEVSQLVADGKADPVLADAAGELGAELIVVGTHGRTGVRRILLGSVAEKTVRLASTSVLVARGEAPVDGYHRVVVGTDFSPTSWLALRSAFELTAAGGHVDVVHAWQAQYVELDLTGRSAEWLLDAAVLELEANRDRVMAMPRREGVTVELHLAGGAPFAVLDERSEGAQLVVVGSHGRRGIRRFVLGSVAEATVRHARCSVLVVR